MNVTGVYSNDAMLRQISEGVKINNVDEDSLMNSKNEWNYFQIPRAVVTHGRIVLQWHPAITNPAITKTPL